MSGLATVAHTSSVKQGVGESIRFLLLLFVWSAWWGGLTFYSLVAVPIGTEQLGSTAQGFITQRVTEIHNWLALVWLIMFALEATLRRSRVLGGLAVSLSVVTLALWLQHARLSDSLDRATQSVPSGFYEQHAMYLWCTAAEWLLGAVAVIVLVVIIKNSRSNECARAIEPDGAHSTMT